MLLLGTGAVGGVIARHLVQSKVVDHLDLGDIDISRAKAIAGKAGEKASALTLNAGDKGELGKALKGKDLVINSALPTYNLAIMDAALDRGVDYLDLAMDQLAQLDLDRAWEKAGLTAVLGVGEDPGISNVFARFAADGMDRVDGIRIRDGETSTSEEFAFMSLFSPEVFIEEATSPATVYEEGKFRKVPPMSGFEDFRFPEPVGKVPICQMDHDEVHTLPRFIGKGLRFVDFKLALPPDAAEILRVVSRLGLMSTKEVDVRGVKVRPKDFFLSLVPPPGALAGKVDGHAVILVEVQGAKEGVQRIHTLWSSMGHREAYRKYGCTATSYLTGTGAAIGALTVARGDFDDPGVFAPECMPAKGFLQELPKVGVEVQESITLTRPALG